MDSMREKNWRIVTFWSSKLLISRSTQPYHTMTPEQALSLKCIQEEQGWGQDRKQVSSGEDITALFLTTWLDMLLFPQSCERSACEHFDMDFKISAMCSH